MKRILILLIITLLITNIAYAADGTMVSDTMEQFKSQISGFLATFQGIARSTLLSLGLIQIVLTFGFMALRGELELGGIVAQLIKVMLIYGFFLFLINSPQYLLDVIQKFKEVAVSAGGNGANIDNIFGNIIDMWDKFFKSKTNTGQDMSLGQVVMDPGAAIGQSLADIGKVIIGFIAALIATIAIVILGGQALMYYAFSIFSIYIGIMWLGFGSFEQTRPWAINAITNVIRYGAKYMMTLIIIGLSFKMFSQYTSSLDSNDFYSILRVIIFSLLIVTVNSGVGGFVDSFFTGGGGGENNRGMQMVQSAASAATGAATGAVVGAAVGSSAAVNAARDSGSGGLGQAGAGLGGALKGALRGAVTGGGAMPSNWASGRSTFGEHKDSKSSQKDSGSGGSSSSTNPYNMKDINTNGYGGSSGGGSSTTVDGDVGGNLKGTTAEPKVGGEINPNQADKT